MSLEDVKGRKWYVTTKGARHSYARVVHTQECSYVPRATNAHVWTRNPLDEPDTSGLYPCERCKPTASPKTIARGKAKLAADLAEYEAAEREREERRERARRLWELLSPVQFSPHPNNRTFRRGQKPDGDTCVFDYDGHRFEIREIE